MNKYLKKINNHIKIEDGDYKKIFCEYKKIRQDLQKNINRKFKIVGSFDKGLMTNKTNDIDVDILIKGDNEDKQVRETASLIKKQLVSHFKGPGNFANKKVSVEFDSGNFVYSFTVVIENDVGSYKVVFDENSINVDKIISKEDKEEFNDKLFSDNVSKRQRWIARKFVRIMVYLIDESRQDLSKYQLETILLNELIPNEKKTNVNEKFDAFKNFLKNLGDDRYKDSLINLKKKNESAYKNLINKSKKISNDIEKFDLSDFSIWIKKY